MLSKRALGLAVGLVVLPQMVHAGESAARCVDASAPEHAAEDSVYRIADTPAYRGDRTVRQRDAMDGRRPKRKATQAA